MILLPLMTLVAAAQAQPRPVEGLDPRLVQTEELDAALAEYDRLCLAAPFNRAAYEAAIQRSAWGFQPSAGAPDGALAYQAGLGFAFFRDSGRLPQCNLDTATPQPRPDAVMIARIEALLVRRLRRVPPRRETPTAIFWQWPGEPEKMIRLYLMRRPDPRQLTLTLQKWPTALARDNPPPQGTRP